MAEIRKDETGMKNRKINKKILLEAVKNALEAALPVVRLWTNLRNSSRINFKKERGDNSGDSKGTDPP